LLSAMNDKRERRENSRFGFYRAENEWLAPIGDWRLGTGYWRRLADVLILILILILILFLQFLE
jgi:hypothetical protein